MERQVLISDKEDVCSVSEDSGNFVKRRYWRKGAAEITEYRENCILQLAYITDEAVMEEMGRCRKILQKLNFADRSDAAGIAEIVKELLGKCEDACINPLFYCDYGSHIEVGKNGSQCGCLYGRTSHLSGYS